MESEVRRCQNCKFQFTIEPEDFQFYEKIKVPPPTFCPECRMKRRMVFRNERALFKRKCGLCQKEIITIYHPDENMVVYCNECWWSDQWDAAQYGKEYDFNSPFFLQFGELLRKVPRMALEGYQNENSPYTNYTWFCKNTYLSSSALYSENVLYSHGITHSQDSMDCTYVYNSQLCYESLDSQYCANSIFLRDCRECIDSAFLYDCRGCKNCFMSSNLRNKSFVFRNEELSKDDYKKKMEGIDFGDYKTVNALILEYNELQLNSLHRFANLFKTTNSSGHSLINAKNAKHCFTGEDLENVRYAIRLIKIKDSADLYGVGDGGELLYEGVNVGYRDSMVLFSSNTFEGMRNAIYCDYCRTSQDVFGCVGIRGRQYHVLNKAYSKEEYGSLTQRIIKHMEQMPLTDKRGRVYRYGEFFPAELSPFAYNETVAQEYFPLIEDEVTNQGFRWRKFSVRDYKITKALSELPENIKDAPDSLLVETIGCAHSGSCDEQCTTAFKIIESELQLYRRMNLPLPRLCPNCRHYRRLKLRNPLNVRLWHRKCQCSGMVSARSIYKNTRDHFHGSSPCLGEFETPYAPDRPEIVYCEQCYNSEVV